MWRNFWHTMRYIFIGPNVDMTYDDGCTGIPELDNPHRN